MPTPPRSRSGCGMKTVRSGWRSKITARASMPDRCPIASPGASPAWSSARAISAAISGLPIPRTAPWWYCGCRWRNRMTDKKIKVLLVDDHAVVRNGIRLMLSTVDDIEVIGEAENAQDALRLVREQDFDVALVDIALPGKNGL